MVVVFYSFAIRHMFHNRPAPIPEKTRKMPDFPTMSSRMALERVPDENGIGCRMKKYYAVLSLNNISGGLTPAPCEEKRFSSQRSSVNSDAIPISQILDKYIGGTQ